MGAFGDKFRKAREQRSLTLEDVSNVTKIGSRMLQAIEDERFERLPGGVFNKGFIRAYAKHLGLNDEDAVTDYLACLREAQIGANTVLESEKLPPARRSTDAKPRAPEATGPTAAGKPRVPKPPVVKSRPPSDELPDLQLPIAEHVRPKRNFSSSGADGIPWRVPALVVVVIAAGLLLWNRHTRSARGEEPNSAHASTSASAVAAPATDPSTVRSSAAPLAGPVKSSHAPTPHSSNPQSLGSSAPAVLAASASSSPAPAKPVAAGEQPPVASPPAAATISASAAQPPAKPLPTFTLVIRASENSWISVAADGKTVTEETLIAPAHTSVRATREIVVKAGNAAGISFQLNGKEVPPQGVEGEVKVFTFTSAGLTPPPQNQN